VAAAANSVIILNDLAKQFGRFFALRAVTAEFSTGKLYAVLGDNGAGKTTLLRILAGLAQPTRGIVSVCGTSDLKSVAARIGYMAHPSMLYDELSALENLAYFAALYGVPKENCASSIQQVGLDPALTRPVGQYSQGMRQRLSLARALVHDPEILLLDEPFSNVDVRSAREIAELLGRLRNSGKTVLVVTHQADLLQGLADEEIWMAAGSIVPRGYRQ
jgi:heme ABC exporter ATP-binding subunit CcmA